MRYVEGKKETKIPISWEVAMASKRSKGTKKFVPANKKYPGDEKFLGMLETLDIDDIAAELGVSRHAVMSWIRRRGFKDVTKKIPFIERIERAKVDENASTKSPLMELWAKKRLSKAQGINGWRWSRPWNVDIISAS